MFHYFWLPEKIHASKDYVDFLSKNFCLTVPKSSGGNPSVLCFRKFPVAKNFLYKRGGEEYQDSPSKMFCLIQPKILIGEPFSVSLISGIEKLFASKGYVDFMSKFCVSQCQKIQQWLVLWRLINLGDRKTLSNRGWESIKTFRRKTLCLTVPKLFREQESFSCSLISATAKNSCFKRLSGFSIDFFVS